MSLVVQIALGIVLGSILLAIFPIAIVAIYSTLRTIFVGVGAAALASIGTILLYGIFYIGWYVTTQYVPKPILIIATIFSVVSLLASAVFAIKNKVSVPKSIWFYSSILLAVSLLVFNTAWETYSKYGVLGNELNFVSPFFILLSTMAWAGLLIQKKVVASHEIKP